MNKADYFTKHHPATHHQAIRSAYLYNKTDRSKNYFDCLQDKEDEITVPGEGVLEDQYPAGSQHTLEHRARGNGSVIQSHQPLSRYKQKHATHPVTSQIN
jgi:hypothetical protein